MVERRHIVSRSTPRSRSRRHATVRHAARIVTLIGQFWSIGSRDPPPQWCRLPWPQYAQSMAPPRPWLAHSDQPTRASVQRPHPPPRLMPSLRICRATAIAYGFRYGAFRIPPSGSCKDPTVGHYPGREWITVYAHRSGLDNATPVITSPRCLRSTTGGLNRGKSFDGRFCKRAVRRQ